MFDAAKAPGQKTWRLRLLGLGMGGLCLALIIIFLSALPAPAQETEWPPEVDSSARAAAVEKLKELLAEKYIFPDVGKKCGEHLQAQLDSGAYDDITDAFQFSRALTQDLLDVSHDLHMGVRVADPPRPEETEADEEAEKERQRQIEELFRRTNYGFEKVERLEGNVGYLDLRRLVDASVAGDTAVAAMNFLGNADAIIIDLRMCPGGSPSMIQLISTYFFEESTHLNSFEIREEEEMQQFWTLTHVPGKRMTETPLFVLTSPDTASGAEEFTYNMKNLKRATIVGERTAGGAHPVTEYDISEVFYARIPFGRAVNPITKTNWEGTGIEPDIAVPTDQALDRAHVEALKAVVARTEDEKDKADLLWFAEGLQAKLSPVDVSLETLERYAGDYGPLRVWVEDGKLFGARGDGPAYLLVPLSEDKFWIVEMEEYRLRFVADESGDVSSVALVHISGRQGEYPRDG